MKKGKQFIEWDIIYRKLSSKLSEAEEQQFQAWLNTSSKNRRYFDQFIKYYEKKIETLDPELVEDTTAQFMDRLNRRTPFRKLYLNLRIAASVILPLLLIGGAWLAYQAYNEKSRSIRDQKPIAPISSKAQLVTTGGDILALADFKSEVVDSVAGVHIQNDSLIGLKYPAEQAGKDRQEAFNTLITPRGGEYKLTLSDGTRVWLNCESELKYPVAFIGENRKVVLKGEAFFAVSKNTKPFIVETADLTVQVTGTRFNVRAYADDPIVQTTLTRGSVLVETKNNDGGPAQVVALSPGEQADFHRTRARLNRIQVDTTNFVGWIAGYFRFENKPLDEILKSMSRWYNVNYTYKGHVDSRKPLSGRLNRKDDFDVLMNLVSKISGTAYVRDENQVIISKR